MVRTVVEKRVNEIGRERRHDRLARTHDIRMCSVKIKHIKNITNRRGKCKVPCAKWACKRKGRANMASAEMRDVRARPN